MLRHDNALSAVVFLSTLPARGATSRSSLTGRTGCRFLSTLPARGATYNIMQSQREKFISIHAPREGSD